MKLFTAIVMSLGLVACASAPRPLHGEFSTLLPDEAAQRGATGELVRWGGRIVSVEPQRDHSCFEIVAAPLGQGGRPRMVDRSDGRFIACRNGFYDPEVFQEGREITITGRIDGFQTRKVGDFDYRYPRVAADVVYLWPELRQRGMGFEGPVFYGRYGHRWPVW